MRGFFHSILSNMRKKEPKLEDIMEKKVFQKIFKAELNSIYK